MQDVRGLHTTEVDGVRRKFYCDVWGPVTESAALFPMAWPPPLNVPEPATRYVFEVEFPEPEGVEVPATPAVVVGDGTP